MKPDPHFSETMARAVRALGTADFIPEVLDLMRRACLFKGAFVNLLSLNERPEHVYDNVRQERRSVVIDRWLDRAWLLDPFVVSYIGGSNEPVMVLRDVAPDRFGNSDYFRIYYKSLRLKDELSVFVDLPNGTLFFSLAPADANKRFTTRDVEKLIELHPIVAALCEQHFHRSPRAGQVDRDGDVNFVSLIEMVCPDLTQREVEVVQSLLRGHSTQSAALLLDVSPATIKVHRKNIYRKLDISSQSALFSMFLQPVND